MLASQAKIKGKGKATPSGSKVAIVVEHDLSVLPFTTTVLGSTLDGVPLKIKIGVPFELMGL